MYINYFDNTILFCHSYQNAEQIENTCEILRLKTFEDVLFEQSSDILDALQ